MRRSSSNQPEPASAPAVITERRSALEAKLGHHLALTYSERDALRWLERRERQYKAGSIIVEEGQETSVLHVVASGWLHGSVAVPDGGRQILRFYFVGDLTTTFSIAWGNSAATLTAVSACTLFEMPRDALGRIFHDHPRIGALIYGVSAAEQVAMADRLTSVGRTDTLTRIGTLLLDIRSRLEIVNGADGSVFELPLTLSDLGDAVGVTKTHVSRTLRQLEERKLIEREGRLIRLIDIDALAHLVGFKDRHSHVATDWLPE